MGAHVSYQPVCASTDRLLIERLRYEALPEGTVVITDHQYDGRGKGGSIWHAPPGQNLTFSLVLYPDASWPNMPIALGMCVAMAIRAHIALCLTHSLTVKWPNDLYCDHYKIGGIIVHRLSQTQRAGAAVVGIGINVNQMEFDNPHWTSMALASGRKFSLLILFTELLQVLETYYISLKKTSFEDLKHRYTQCLYGLYVPHVFETNQKRFRGIITGLDAEGRLLVQNDSGNTTSYHTGQIKLVQSSVQS